MNLLSVVSYDPNKTLRLIFLCCFATLFDFILSGLVFNQRMASLLLKVRSCFIFLIKTIQLGKEYYGFFDDPEKLTKMREVNFYDLYQAGRLLFF